MASKNNEKPKEFKKQDPFKRPKSQHEANALQIQELMGRVDQLVDLPERHIETFRLPPPPEFVYHSGGSVAGAGSGDFHKYRAQRRRERTFRRFYTSSSCTGARLGLMEMEARLENEKDEYEGKIAAVRASEEEKTAKKRAKRQRLKALKRKKTSDGAAISTGDDADGIDTDGDESEQDAAKESPAESKSPKSPAIPTPASPKRSTSPAPITVVNMHAAPVRKIANMQIIESDGF
jgi:hypothetical protein